ncbi:MAG: flagellar P-ring protein precursor FlgI, partial [Candidatus Krumholzibacteriia bacterium]
MLKRNRFLNLVAILSLLLTTNLSWAADGSRIKDLAFLQGTTSEALIGYGLVVGLNGSGDSGSAENTSNSIATLLEKLDVTVSAGELKAKNVAAVIVTANLDPNLSAGGKIDIKVNSLNDASSLEGGELVMTPLRAADGTICVLAQGSVSIGGFNIKSGANNSFRKNHAQAGLVSNGGTVKVPLNGQFMRDGTFAWLLHSPDFSTANEVAKSINRQFGR